MLTIIKHWLTGEDINILYRDGKISSQEVIKTIWDRQFGTLTLMIIIASIGLIIL